MKRSFTDAFENPWDVNKSDAVILANNSHWKSVCSLALQKNSLSSFNANIVGVVQDVTFPQAPRPGRTASDYSWKLMLFSGLEYAVQTVVFRTGDIFVGSETISLGDVILAPSAMLEMYKNNLAIKIRSTAFYIILPQSCLVAYSSTSLNRQDILFSIASACFNIPSTARILTPILESSANALLNMAIACYEQFCRFSWEKVVQKIHLQKKLQLPISLFPTNPFSLIHAVQAKSFYTSADFKCIVVGCSDYDIDGCPKLFILWDPSLTLSTHLPHQNQKNHHHYHETTNIWKKKAVLMSIQPSLLKSTRRRLMQLALNVEETLKKYSSHDIHSNNMNNNNNAYNHLGVVVRLRNVNVCVGKIPSLTIGNYEVFDTMHIELQPLSGLLPFPLDSICIDHEPVGQEVDDISDTDLAAIDINNLEQVNMKTGTHILPPKEKSIENISTTRTNVNEAMITTNLGSTNVSQIVTSPLPSALRALIPFHSSDEIHIESLGDIKPIPNTQNLSSSQLLPYIYRVKLRVHGRSALDERTYVQPQPEKETVHFSFLLAVEDITDGTLASLLIEGEDAHLFLGGYIQAKDITPENKVATMQLSSIMRTLCSQQSILDCLVLPIATIPCKDDGNERLLLRLFATQFIGSSNISRNI